MQRVLDRKNFRNRSKKRDVILLAAVRLLFIRHCGRIHRALPFSFFRLFKSSATTAEKNSTYEYYDNE